MRPFLILFVVLSAFATRVSAQAPYLIKDLGNTGSSTAPQSSEPKAFLSIGATLFFTATTETNGREPWVHDASGTRLLRDINPGPASSDALGFVELTPGVVVFTANDGENGTQLWRSDGTEAGTILVKVVNATGFAFAPSFAHDGKVFFFTDDGVHGTEPWVTDGTPAGTQLLADTRAGSLGNSGGGSFFIFGGILRFSASTSGIWRTDGTPAGTTIDVPLISIGRLAITSTAILFPGYDTVNGFALWKSDATVAGTAMVKDLRTDTTLSPFSSSLAATSSGAVFIADDGTGAGRRLWTTDGTAANTVPLNAFPANAVAHNSTFFYRTSKGIFFSAGSSAWRTDGTEAGTYIAATFAGGVTGSVFGFTDAFSKIYFSLWVGSDPRLMHIGGTPGETAVHVRSDLPARDVTFTGGKFWFAGKDDTNGRELWTSEDGTAAGTHLVTNLAPDPARSSTPVALTAAGSFLYFHPSSPQELWRSDGTAGGTIEVTDVDNTLISPSPFGQLTPYRGDIYYRRSHSELYRVDGVYGGATKISDGALDVMTADENYIYLWEYSSAHVHRTDGTAAGTIALYDANEPDHLRGNYDYLDVLTSGGYAWIRCYHGLFRTAGTVETTRRLASVPEGAYLTGGFETAGGLLYSAISGGSSGYELWRSDGTGGGSFILDLFPGAPSSSPSDLTPAGRLLFFTATDNDHGPELWRTDGTVAGTFMVKDIRPGTASSAPAALVALGETLYFAANDGTNGVELWKSDGTEAGTVLVRDIAPGSFSSKPTGLAVADGKVWFAANDGLHGIEVWSSDGTEDGTILVGDIIPGSSSSAPEKFTAAGSTLFFSATTDAEGRELWGLPLTMGHLSVTGAHVTEGNSGSRSLRFTVTRNGPSAGAASVSYATSPGTATAGTDYGTASGTLNFAAAETSKTVDIAIYGDTETESNESVFLQLSSPTGVALQNATAAGVIDDDDPRADLAVEIVQNSLNDDNAARLVKVTNHGPSSAYGATVTYTESPYDFVVYAPGGTGCTNTVPTQCTISFLQPGESRTLTLSRHTVQGIVDPAMPAGRTITASVSAPVTDANPSNNTASRMTTGDGHLLLPSSLVIGTPATATIQLNFVPLGATDVTLTSSAGNVVVEPATVRLEPQQRTATFTLTASAGAEKTLLTTTIGSEVTPALVAPIVANGQTPLLDVAIVATNDTTLDFGQLFIIPVRVAARYPDGTQPAGLVTLLDQNGSPLSQLNLDAEARATFTRADPPPGAYNYRVRYEGDARFNPLTAPLPPITIAKALSSVVIHAPAMSCSNTMEIRMVVSGPAGAPAPTGTVVLRKYPNVLGTFTLAPTGVPGQSSFTATVTLQNGYHDLSATYSGDDYFFGASGWKSLTIGCSAMNLVATASSATSVVLSWTAPPERASNRYEVYRSDSMEGPYQWIQTTAGFGAVDSTAQPGRVYIYFVGAYSTSYGQPAYYSNTDIASTFVYADNPLAAGMTVKSAHLSELRAMVGRLRAVAALPALTFTGSVAPGSVIDARHITELRSSIDVSRARLSLPAISWAQPNAVRGAAMRAATVQELRAGAN